MHKGVTVWFTGLSGAGKTTIATRVEQILKQQGYRVERLDGDVVRQGLTRDLGFSKEDRDRNIERVTFVAKLLTRNGVIVLASFISPYHSMRAYSRREIGEFLEVHVHASLDTLMRRDVKGLYRKALAGEIKNFTGVDDPYEVPEHPDLVCHTDDESVEQSVEKVLNLLRERGYLGRRVATVEDPQDNGRLGPGDPGNRPATPGPIAPHGGTLVERILTGDARADAIARAGDLVQIHLDEREQSDLELIGIGAYSPLTGFMGTRDYDAVVEAMRLSDGTVWSLPITLAVSREQADAIALDSEIALLGSGGRVAGLMRVLEKFTYDREREAQWVFGTTDAAHPGVARVYGQGEVLLAGPVWYIPPEEADMAGDPFAPHQLTPRQSRRLFDEKGWRKVVAFQTRNPIHRAHEYIQKAALETVDGLFLHPLVGATKADDIDAEVRLRCYQEILRVYYPRDRVAFGVFPAAMRYAGPREAIFHAICRKNYGCTHFIVGRDHAGVGKYYGTYEAQQMFDRFDPAELGITPLKFEHAFFCRACGGMATTKTCPHDAEHHVFLSGTQVRRMLSEGVMPPPEFSRPEVARILVEAQRARQAR